MKTSIKTIAASFALAALMAGPASAAVSIGDVTQDVNSAVSAGSNVFVHVDGDTVTLTGYVEGAYEKSAAVHAAEANEGIDRVIDLTTTSN